MTEEVFDNLCHSYCSYIDTPDEKLAKAIIKVLGINYDEDTKIFSCKSPEFEGTRNLFNYITTRSKWIQFNLSSKITPLSLSSFDVECIEDLFTKPEYAESIISMAPLFSCIGWILDNGLGIWRIKFEGSATYDLWKISPDFCEKVDWKHPYGCEDDDLISEVTNGGSMWEWNKGDFLDGITMNDIKNIDWKKDIAGEEREY